MDPHKGGEKLRARVGFETHALHILITIALLAELQGLFLFWPCSSIHTINYLLLSCEIRSIIPTTCSHSELWIVSYTHIFSGCHPYYIKDPFILEKCPHVYFVGNQPKYQSKIINGKLKLFIKVTFWTAKKIYKLLW